MSLVSTAHPVLGTVLRSSWAWLRIHPKTRWALIIGVVCTICYMINTDSAWATTEDQTSATTFFLPLGDVTDTHGVPIWRYTELPFDPGNATHPVRSIRSFIASIFWVAYMFPVLLLIGLVDWALKFEWLEWLTAPFITISDSIGGVLEAWMLIPLGVLVSAVVIGFGYARGRTGAATVEFVMVVLVFGLIASPVANPLNWLSGEGGSSESGVISKAADFGTEAGSLTVNQEVDPGDSSVASSIIDITLRNPTLTMSFGSPLEGDCAEAWDQAATSTENDTEQIRKKVTKCSDEAKTANETDSAIWLLHYFLSWPAMVGVMALIAVFLGFLIYQVAQVFIGSIIVIIRGFLALFPGRSREAWLNSLFQVAISAVMVGVFIWALTVYMWVLKQIVENIPPGLIQLGTILTGILILIVAITFWRMRKAGKSIGEKIAKALGKTGLSKNSPERSPSKFGSTAGNLAKQAASKGLDLHQRSRMFRTMTTGAKAAATIGTGGTAGIAAKVGTDLVGKAATTKAMMAASRTAQSRKGVTAASKAADAARTTPKAGLPAVAPPPVATDGNGPAAMESGTQPVASLPAPSGPEGAPSSTLPPRTESRNEVAVPGNHQGAKASDNAPAVAPQQVNERPHRVSHIPEGNYGGTWVHKNGQAHRPVTVTPDGRPARNVPSEEKITRGFKSGDSWVISPGVKPSSRHANASAAPPQGPATQAASPAPTRKFPNPRPMQSRTSQPRNQGGAPSEQGSGQPETPSQNRPTPRAMQSHTSQIRNPRGGKH